MKQILSENIALVDGEILNHPSTIFTNDNIEVITFVNVTELNYHLAQKDPMVLEQLPIVGYECMSGKIYGYNNKIIRCIQTHIRMHFEPELTPALFVVIERVEGYPEWKQPEPTNPYMKGDRVMYKLFVWESVINNNVWSPDAYPAGWKKVL